jgi:hypothetical protein
MNYENIKKNKTYNIRSWNDIKKDNHFVQSECYFRYNDVKMKHKNDISFLYMMKHLCGRKLTKENINDLINDNFKIDTFIIVPWMIEENPRIKKLKRILNKNKKYETRTIY